MRSEKVRKWFEAKHVILIWEYMAHYLLTPAYPFPCDEINSPIKEQDCQQRNVETRSSLKLKHFKRREKKETQRKCHTWEYIPSDFSFFYCFFFQGDVNNVLANIWYPISCETRHSKFSNLVSHCCSHVQTFSRPVEADRKREREKNHKFSRLRTVHS